MGMLHRCRGCVAFMIGNSGAEQKANLVYTSKSRFDFCPSNNAIPHLATSGGNAPWNLELSNSYKASC